MRPKPIPLKNGEVSIDHALVKYFLTEELDVHDTQTIVKILNLLCSGMKDPEAIAKIRWSKSDRYVVIGDLHGNVDDLRIILKENKEKNYKKLKRKYVVLGDFIDRGAFSLETALASLCLQHLNRANFHVLRGNHEDKLLSHCKVDGFDNLKLSPTSGFGWNLERELLARYLEVEWRSHFQVDSTEVDLYKALFKKMGYVGKRLNQVARRSAAWNSLNRFISAHQLKMMGEATRTPIRTAVMSTVVNYQFFALGLHEVVNAFKDVFAVLPYALLLLKVRNGKFERNFLFVHGGIAFDDPDAKLEDIGKINMKNFNAHRVLYYPTVVERFDYLSARSADAVESLHLWYDKFQRVHKENMAKKKALAKSLVRSGEAKGFRNSYRILHSMLWSNVAKGTERGVVVDKQRIWSTKLVGLGFLDSDPPFNTFGPDVTKEFLKSNGLDAIFRGHQPKMTVYQILKEENRLGFRFHEKHRNRVVTIHSCTIMQDFGTFLVLDGKNVVAKIYDFYGGLIEYSQMSLKTFVRTDAVNLGKPTMAMPAMHARPMCELADALKQKCCNGEILQTMWDQFQLFSDDMQMFVGSFQFKLATNGRLSDQELESILVGVTDYSWGKRSALVERTACDYRKILESKIMDLAPDRF